MVRRMTLMCAMMLLVGIMLAGCKPVQPKPAGEAATPGAADAALANPASVNCTQQGGTLEIRTDANGGQFGMCLFADGSECEEWALLRGTCKPGEATPAAPTANMANPASVNCTQQGGTLEIRKDATGGEYGMCLFADGSECEEWGLLRGTCTPGQVTPAATSANMPNPASVNCADKGGTLEIRKDASGGEYGMCVFSDGSECEEWAFMRGECAPGESPAGGAKP